MYIDSIKHQFQTGFVLDVSDIKLEKNTIIGLIGPNGAGKTTLMNILAKRLKPNLNCNMDFNEEMLYIPSNIEPYNFLTVLEFINLSIKYSDIKIDNVELLDLLDLTDKKDSFIDELSQGMKKKLTLIQLFNDKYDLIILDEPFNSIDVDFIINIKSILKKLKKRTTIIISSHILDTLNDICDSFIYIKEGKIKETFSNNKSIEYLEGKIIEKNN